MTIVSSDTFTRANQSGWGTASDSETWTAVNLSVNDTASITSNEGQISTTAGGVINLMRLGSLTRDNQIVLVRMSENDTRGNTAVVGRLTDINNFYNCYFSNGSVNIEKRVGGTFTGLSSFSPAQTISNGTFFWIKFAIQGTTLQAKCWVDGNPEPTSYSGTVTDTSLTTGGWGIKENDLGHTIIFQYDNFSVDDLAVTYAFVDSLTPSDSLSETDVYIPAESITLTEIPGIATWPIDALSVSESIAYIESLVPVEAPPFTETLLELDSYSVTESLPLSEQLLASVPANNNPFNATDILPIVESIFYAVGYGPIEANATSDVASSQTGPIETLTLADSLLSTEVASISDPPAITATQHYVSKNGTNADGASWASAWNELNQINWSVINPGDYILIDGGPAGMTYNTTLTVGKSGTSGNPITIQRATTPGHDGQVAIFGGRNTPLPYCGQVTYNPTYSGNQLGSGIVCNNNNYVTIDGMTWHGLVVYGCVGGAGTNINNCTNITFRNMQLYDNGTIGGSAGNWHPGAGSVNIGLTSSSYCTFYGIDSYDPGEDSFQPNSVNNITISYCWLHNTRANPSNNALPFNQCNHNDGMQIWTGATCSYIAWDHCILGPGLENDFIIGNGLVQINNSTVSNCLFLPGVANNLWIEFSANATIDHVTVWTLNGQAVDVKPGPGNTLTNSIIYGGGLGSFVGTSSNNCYFNTSGISGINADPNFVTNISPSIYPGGGSDTNPIGYPSIANAATFDFSLQAGSPATGLGSSITSVSTLVQLLTKAPYAGDPLFTETLTVTDSLTYTGLTNNLMLSTDAPPLTESILETDSYSTTETLSLIETILIGTPTANNQMTFEDDLVVSDLMNSMQRGFVESLGVVESEINMASVFLGQAIAASSSVLIITGGLITNLLLLTQTATSVATYLPKSFTSLLIGSSLSAFAQSSTFATNATASSLLANGGSSFFGTNLVTSSLMSPAAYTVVAFTEITALSDSIFLGTSFGPVNAPIFLESIQGTEVYVPIETTPPTTFISGANNNLAPFTEGLIALESIFYPDAYVPSEVQAVAESILAGASEQWVDVLSASDTFTAQVAAPIPLAYNATVYIRSGQATAHVRSGQGTVEVRS